MTGFEIVGIFSMILFGVLLICALLYFTIKEEFCYKKKFFITYKENNEYKNDIIDYHPVQWAIDHKDCALTWWNEVGDKSFNDYKNAGNDK